MQVSTLPVKAVAALATVVSVHRSRGHHFSKDEVPVITLMEGYGVEGDAHCGITVKHRSRVAKDPFAPNLRQVHLMHDELFDKLRAKGFDVQPGALGENITTHGLDLLSLPEGTELHVGDSVVIKLTGLRNPCAQIDKFKRGLMAAVLGKTADGQLIRKSGVMGIVLQGGSLCAGLGIRVKLPALPHRAMQVV
jgi:MOSC domain